MPTEAATVECEEGDTECEASNAAILAAAAEAAAAIAAALLGGDDAEAEEVDKTFRMLLWWDWVLQLFKIIKNDKTWNKTDMN